MSEATRPPEVAVPPRPAKGPRAAAAPPPTGFRALLARASRLVGSFGVAMTLLLLLLVLTLLGTLEQQYSSLYDVQRKYFESWVLVHKVGSFPIPLPGATLVMALLGLNLIVGGIVRMRKKASTIGVLIAHVGIIILLGAGLVETVYADKGNMRVFLGGTSDEFQSYFEWEIALTERSPSGGATEFVLGHDRLDGLAPQDQVRFTSERLPFDVRVAGWQRNAIPESVGLAGGVGAVEGWVLAGLPPAHEAEANLPGAFVTLLPKTSSPEQRGLLWGGEELPWVATVDGHRFEVDLRRRTWRLPFSVTLDRFVHLEHPGTSSPKEFSSFVTRHEGGRDVGHHITMNEPLRQEGYTLYQSSWGPQPGDKPGTRTNSVFSVVRNPSDRWPIVACSVIALGLLVHFGRKLRLHVLSQSASRTPVSRRTA